MINKRGQGMSTNTIVLLILAVIVLVVLILGFTMGWGKIAPWISQSNVDTIVISCEAACATGGTYDFCSATKNLVDDEKNKISASCVVFSELSEFQKYGIKSCSIDCSLPCDQIIINGEPGSISAGTGFDVSDIAEESVCFVPL